MQSDIQQEFVTGAQMDYFSDTTGKPKVKQTMKKCGIFVTFNPFAIYLAPLVLN